MYLHELKEEIDRWCVAAPEERGFGYHDSQPAGRYDPAIRYGREDFFELCEELCRRHLHGSYLLIGVGRRAGAATALSRLCRQLVCVDRDPERLRGTPGAPICGAAQDLRNQVQAALQGPCDLILIDAGQVADTSLAIWRTYADLLRPGGLMVLVDDSQAYQLAPGCSDIPALVESIEREVLAPAGLRWRRSGFARVLHSYVHRAELRSDAELDLPTGTVQRAHPLPTETPGWSSFRFAGQLLAIPGAHPGFCPRQMARHRYPVVLVATDPGQLEARIASYESATPELQQVRELLLRKDAQGAQQAGLAAVRRHPDLDAVLQPALEFYPQAQAPRIALGTWCLFADRRQAGVHLLSTALRTDLKQGTLLQVLANALLEVFEDPDGARSLLAEVRELTRLAHRAEVCARELHGNTLWSYPEMLTPIHGVVQIGAHRGEEVEAFCKLGIARQAYIEALPEACAALQRRCEDLDADGLHMQVIQTALAAETGPVVLRWGEDSARASLLRADTENHDWGTTSPQAHRLECPASTLDELYRQGVLEAGAHNLLFLDVEGGELEVLKGARQSLDHFDLCCIAYLRQPIYRGTTLPQELKGFMEDHGFQLLVTECCVSPDRGDALFLRVRRRGYRG